MAANSILILITLLMVSVTACEKDDSITETENGTNIIMPDFSGYPIVGTNQTIYYNNSTEISAPVVGDDFYGQNANYQGTTPSYHDNGDGTITDLVTGLM